MAQNAEANILVTIKEKGKEVLTGLNSSFDSVIKTAAAVSASLAAIGLGIGKLVLDAAEFDEIKDAFRRLASSQGADADLILESMKKASDGVLSNVETIKVANEALLAGIPVDKLGKITEIAKAAANSTGSSVSEMVETITSGLARGSIMMLRHAGIVFDVDQAYKNYALSLGKTTDQLTEAEKKQAFLNRALEEGQKFLDTLGPGLLSAADKWDIIKAAISNLSIEVGERAKPAFEGLLDVILDVLSSVQAIGINEIFKDLSLDAIEARSRIEDILDVFTQPFKNLIAYGKAAKLAITGNFKEAAETIRSIDSEIMGGSVENQKKAAIDKKRIIDEFNAKEKEADTKKEIEKKEAAIAVEKEKLKEKEKINQEALDVDREMYYEKIDLEKKLEERALEERIRQRKLREDAEKQFIENSKKQIEEASSYVTTLISSGMQGVTSKALGAIANTFLPEIGGAVSQVFNLLSQNTEQFKQTLATVFSTDFIDNVAKNLVTLAEEFPGILDRIINYLAENMPAIVEKLVASIIANLPEIISAFTKGLIKMTSDPKFIAGLAAAIAKGFAEGIKDIAGDLSETIKKAVKDGIQGLTDIGGGGGGSGGVVGKVKKTLGLYHGGIIPAYADGGLIDNQMIRATAGEFIVNRDSASSNLDLLNAINNSNGRSLGNDRAIIINVNGGLLGDRESARQFARAVDAELYRLRQGNESRAFDRSIT